MTDVKMAGINNGRYYGENRILNLVDLLEIENVMEKSIDKKYFLGQTPDLSLSTGNRSYAELTNPADSGVNLHVSIVTCNNFNTTESFRMHITLDSGADATLTEETGRVSPSNLIDPASTRKIKLNYVSDAAFNLTGASVFTRFMTEKGFQILDRKNYIIPPGKNFGVVLSAGSGATMANTARVAFGWWEEPL